MTILNNEIINKKIAYVATNTEALSLLQHLAKDSEGEIDYNNLKDVVEKNPDSIIEKLVEFEMVEQSNKRAYGYTKEHSLYSSIYNITDYGFNFIKNYEALYNTSDENHIVQLSKGDFEKFVKMLHVFINSDDDISVREAYEFIFGINSKNTNFFNISRNKFLTMYRKLVALKKAIFVAVTVGSYKNIIKDFEKQVIEFNDVVTEIFETLRISKHDIEASLKRLLKEAEGGNRQSDFYYKRAKLVFGTNMIEGDDSEKHIQFVVVDFCKEVLEDKISDTYSNIALKILKLSGEIQNQLSELKKQMSRKAECIALAHKIATLPLEEARELLTEMLPNRTLHYVTESEYAVFNGNVLEVKLPDLQKQNKKPKEIPMDLKTIKLLDMMDKREEAQKTLKKLEQINKILEWSQNGSNSVLDHDSYKLVKKSISQIEIDQKERKKIEKEKHTLLAKRIESQDDFILRGKKAGENKIRKSIYKNQGVTFYTNGNIQKQIEVYTERINRITARITEQESNYS